MTFAGQCDEATSVEILNTAVEKGVTFIDTADAYPIPPDIRTAGRTEEVIGRWLAGRSDRDQFVLATKCKMTVGPGANDQGLSRRHILRACEASLKRLKVDHIDLYQAHFPDPETPIDESLRAFDDLVRSGKVRYIGASNFAAWQLALALGRSEHLSLARFDSIQPRYNAIYREPETELLPLCRDQGVGVIVYNPIAGGVLSGKYKPGDAPQEGTRFTMGASGALYRERYWHQANFEAVESLRAICDEKNIPLATAAVAWVLAQPGITSAIVGASRPGQLTATLAGSEVTLDEEILAVFEDAWWGLPRRK